MAILEKAELMDILSEIGDRFKEMSSTLDRPTIGLALGGGSARGIAHIGVIQVLESKGVPIDIVAGCSMGALIGGAYSMKGSVSELEDIAVNIKSNDLLKYTDLRIIRTSGLLAGNRVEKLLSDITDGKSFYESKIPFVCSSVDIFSGREVPLYEGEMHKAIRASISLPGVFEPAKIGDHYLVDGGLLNPVPVSYLRALGVDIVIAVDVLPEVTYKGKKKPSMITVLVNSMDIMQKLSAEVACSNADIVLRPYVEDITAIDFLEGSTLIDRGRTVVQENLEEIRNVLRGRGVMI